MIGRRGRATEALRALRQPLVALCAVLLVSNLLVPAASLGFGPAVSGHLCHGGLPTAPDGDGVPGPHLFQTCCFSAAVALVPATLAQPPAAAERPGGPVAAVVEHVRALRMAGARRIRAPPLS